MQITQIIQLIRSYTSSIDTRDTVLKIRKINIKNISDKLLNDIHISTPAEYSDKARIYLYILQKYESKVIHKCNNVECQNNVKFDNDKNIFRMFCSVRCRNKDSKIRRQISNTWDDNKIKQKVKKTKETNIIKYGVDNPMKNNEIRKKVRATNMSKYGACSSTYKHFKNIDKYNKEYIIKHFLKNDILDINGLISFFNISRSNINKRMAYFGISYKKRLVSSYEQEIAEYILSLGIDIIQSDRTLIKPLEIDILIPEHKIAIEFNGLYWHSFGTNNVNQNQGDKYYQSKRHLIKTEECLKHGYQLFHIFENEWIENKILWKSILKNAFGLSKKIHARKCQTKVVSISEARDFLKMNHLQGYINAATKIGLYYNDELVSIMTFGKPRMDKDADVELYRMCSKLNTVVVGGASKMLKYYDNNYSYNLMVSYANRRWSKGNLYNTIGFEFINISPPNMFYIKDRVESRLKYQKHKIEKLGLIFDQSKTATQNMLINGYRVIYDSGNYKYFKTM